MIRSLAVVAAGAACLGVLLPATAAARPPGQGRPACGTVTVFGKPEVVRAFPIPCEEAMAVANKMVATWPSGSRFVEFDGWSCAGVTGGEASAGYWWDLDCENAATGAQITFTPPGAGPG